MDQAELLSRTLDIVYGADRMDRVPERNMTPQEPDFVDARSESRIRSDVAQFVEENVLTVIELLGLEYNDAIQENFTTELRSRIVRALDVDSTETYAVIGRLIVERVIWENLEQTL